MSVEVGQVLNGKITGIQSFGAFVALEGQETQGLVHISEVSNTYVKDINEFLKVGQDVQVKVIKVDDDHKKISLSMRALMENPEGERPRRGERSERSANGDRPQRKRGTTLGARKHAPQQFISDPDAEGYSTLADALNKALGK